MPVPEPNSNDEDVRGALQEAEEQLGDNFDGEIPPEEEEPRAAAPPSQPTGGEEDFLDREVPQGKLSGYWKQKALEGRKVTYRDVMDGQTSAEEKIREQGQEANRYRDETKVLRATMENLSRQISDLRRPVEQPRRAPNYEDVGVRDPSRVMLEDPAHYGRATAELGARLAKNELDPRIQNIEQQQQDILKRQQTLDIRTASDKARRSLGIDEDAWSRREPYLYAAASMYENGPMDPNSWIAASRASDEAFGTSPQRVTVPREGIMRGNPSAGSSRATPVRTPAGPVKGGRVRGLVRAVGEDLTKYGLSQEEADEVMQKTEGDLQNMEGR